MTSKANKTGLSLFLAERYLPRATEEAACAEAERVQAASEELGHEGAHVRYLGTTLLPGDETCLAFFEARSANEVRQLADLAAIAYQRVVEAVRIGKETR